MKGMFVLLAAATLTASLAQSAEIQITGFTRGCFYTGMTACTPTADADDTATYQELTYQGLSFDDLTIDGALSATVGTFTLRQPEGGGTRNYDDVNFVLGFFLSSPPPGGGNEADGRVEGSLNSTSSSVNVTYGLSHDSGGPGLLLYSVAGGGPLTVHVAPVNIRLQDVTAGNPVDQTVHFHGSAIPEPGTYALMGAGLGALLLLRRKLA